MSLIKTEADTAAGAIEISPAPSIPSSADPQPLLAMSAPQDFVSTDSSTANSEPTPSAPTHNPVSSSPHSQSQPVADGMNSTGNSNEPQATNDVSASGITQTSALERGPLGLAPDEEEWIKSRMEYAVHE
ncbi:hypothetical protein BG011_007085 [Mortierella polycephala]|uniref:Uncharacterized protein n=1 Tax=Mortierella polycephala TaxID=41804 RepID=A0A9P6PT40_9FUNG|nr:hypothetical protein BG011_007085 [Mortierella polycephala]